MRDSGKLAIENLIYMFNLSSLYILRTQLFCMSKYNLTKGSYVQTCNTRGRGSYRIGRLKTMVFERLPKLEIVSTTDCPKLYKNSTTPKTFKTKLKNDLVPKLFLKCR